MPRVEAQVRCHVRVMARHRSGVSLEPDEVLLRRGRGGTAMHVVAAADELVRHLAATEADPLAEDGPLMVLARAGALALVSRAEVTRSVVHR